MRKAAQRAVAPCLPDADEACASPAQVALKEYVLRRARLRTMTNMTVASTLFHVLPRSLYNILSTHGDSGMSVDAYIVDNWADIEPHLTEVCVHMGATSAIRSLVKRFAGMETVHAKVAVLSQLLYSST